ncbi:hypothetical protein DRH27_05970 [Candidatus Falkowbacteria bacterium]|nr:MAG: hypothetical protein DRH27_05970 [Candidatus Falkowbacteria bacterium]
MSSLLTVAKRALRNMVAASDVFNGRLPAGADPLKYIHLTHKVLESSLEFDAGPFAVIYYEDGALNYVHDSTDTGFNLIANGELLLLLRAPADKAAPETEDAERFEDWAGETFDQVGDLAGVGENLLITTASLSAVPMRTAFEEDAERAHGPFWECEFTVAWGLVS